jgi:hypothetical protein
MQTCLSEDLLSTVRSNLEGMSSAEQARGLEVLAIRSRIAGLHFVAHAGQEIRGVFTRAKSAPDSEDENELGRGERVQIHVRFAALERETIWSDGKVVQRADPVVRFVAPLRVLH